MSYRIEIIVLCVMTNLYPSISQEPSVNLPQGRVVGTKVYLERSLVPVEIYYGIPYATPPIGRYRFSAPERHTGWRRTFQAHRLPPKCHSEVSDQTDKYSEDCLFLNIWTARQSDGTLLPVIIVLYSDSWTRGGISLPCQDLAAEGVVVVTVEYRLHVLGFYNMGTISARGNLALLDQYLAFLWVRENIAAFGGDPNMITILGHSAGADSILHHLTSPRANGLFQRAVIMSPRNIWQLIDEENKVDAKAIESACRDIALSLGCSRSEVSEILHCMRSRSLSDILSIYSNSNWSKLMQPVPESYLPESEQYLPTSLLTALSNTKQSTMQVDLLLGTTDLEALNYNDENFKELMKWNASYVTDYVNNKSIPDLLRMFDLHQSELMVRAIRWEYWNDTSLNVDNAKEAVEHLARIETSAKWGAAGALLAARLARRVSRLYVYRYSHPATIDLQGNPINFSGAVHGSDLLSLLGDALVLQIARRPPGIDQKRFSAVFRRYIVNFVKYGSPENENKWIRYKAGDAHIYEIREDDSDRESGVTREVKFWLQYLPELSGLFVKAEKSDQLTLEKEDGRLRGGVFAMCGVAVVLILLLCASAILLQRQRLRRRFSISDDNIQNK
nr:putative antennal esterase CXE37 [Ectropis grisescens]